MLTPQSVFLFGGNNLTILDYPLTQVIQPFLLAIVVYKCFLKAV